jgi:PAS domain S-box-containing protein
MIGQRPADAPPRPAAAEEDARILALHGYDILDTPAEQAFDDLAALAAAGCAAPMSLLGLVDRDRVWFKSRVGLDLAQVPRDGSFCASTIDGSGVLVVRDALEDEHFASGALVTGRTGVRFYAGVPLVSPGGHALGALCVLDRTPRDFSAENAQMLRVLAQQAVAQLELRRTTAALEQSERRFRSIIEEAEEAYVSFAADGVIREWNREAERLLGWTQEEIIGSSVLETVVPADLWQRAVAALAEEHGEGEEAPLVATRVDGTAMTKSGRNLPVEFTFLPLKFGGERRINMLLHDISARRRVAAKRERLLKTEQDAGVELTTENEELRELDALKNQFVSVVSHELRTPLTAIRGYLEIVLGEEPGPLNDEQKRFLEIVDFSSEQLLRVVGDLLLIGKVEAGHLALQIAEVDLHSTLEACVVAAKPAADAKQIDLRLTAEYLPSIAADRGRLTQALGNIISNAIKFTEEGHVDVQARSEGGHAVIEVTDTGAGVPAAEVDHLFVPFFRASTTTGQAIPGTGLGLSIAKEIVEAHGGTISVESEEGSGTSFRVELPTNGAEL